MVREHELSVRHWCFALLNFVHLVIVSARDNSFCKCLPVIVLLLTSVR